MAVHTITIRYDSDAKRIDIHRPKSAALTVEALGLALQAMANRELKEFEKSDSGIRVASRLPIPPGLGGHTPAPQRGGRS